MKKLIWPAMGLAAAIAGGLYGFARCGFAQDIAKDDMRYEVNASIGKLVEAANRVDVTAVMAAISEKPEVTVIADGETYQGTTDIRAHVERLLGQRGKYVFQLGPLAIANVRGMALATGAYTLRAGGSQAIAARGAVTFLMERGAHRRWVVAHLHRSNVTTKPQID